MIAQKYRLRIWRKGRDDVAIGNIGKAIVFETNDQRILNFTKFNRTVKGRWASHNRVGKKPKKQFLGPDVSSLTFTIELNAEHGVKPRATLKKIEELVANGKPQKVVIGCKTFSKNKYVITEVSSDFQRVLNKGEVAKITCDITMEEYA